MTSNISQHWLYRLYDYTVTDSTVPCWSYLVCLICCLFRYISSSKHICTNMHLYFYFSTFCNFFSSFSSIFLMICTIYTVHDSNDICHNDWNFTNSLMMMFRGRKSVFRDKVQELFWFVKFGSRDRKCSLGPALAYHLTFYFFLSLFLDS